MSMVGLVRWMAGLFRRWGIRRATGTTVNRTLRAARATIGRKRYCLLATPGVDGVDARVLQPFPPDADFRVWLGTSPTSRKAAQLKASPRATLVYQDDAKEACVVMIGEAHVVDDPALRRRHFMSAWWAFFPEGPDVDFALLRFEPHRIEVIDFNRAVTPPPFGLRPAVLERSGEGWALAS